MHGPTPVVPPGCPTVLIGGLPAGRVGDAAACVPPDVILMGALTVLIGGMPAARITDPTAHGGVVSSGCTTVLIGTAAAIPSGPMGRQLSRSLASAQTQAGGSADAADVQLVADELACMPPPMLAALARVGTRIVASRGAVTDHLTSLQGVTPRGWPTGSTWDIVPGAFMPSTNEVVIATIGHGTPAGAHVPRAGEGHGSANLAVHEVTHAYDFSTTPNRSHDAAFNAARTSDAATLSAYESQAGVAGKQETYAESAARYYGGDPSDAATHPALNNYWAGQP